MKYFIEFYQIENDIFRLFTGFSRIKINDESKIVILNALNAYTELRQFIIDFKPKELYISLIFFSHFKNIFPLVNEFKNIMFYFGGPFFVGAQFYKSEGENYKIFDKSYHLEDDFNNNGNINFHWIKEELLYPRNIIKDKINEGYYINTPLTYGKKCYYGKCLFCDARKLLPDNFYRVYNFKNDLESYIENGFEKNLIHFILQSIYPEDLDILNNLYNKIEEKNIFVSSFIRNDFKIIKKINEYDSNFKNITFKFGLEYFSDIINNEYLNKQEYFDNFLFLLKTMIKKEFKLKISLIIDHFINDDKIENEVKTNLLKTKIYFNILREKIGFFIEPFMYIYNDYLNDFKTKIPNLEYKELNEKINDELQFKNYIALSKNKKLDKYVFNFIKQNVPYDFQLNFGDFMRKKENEIENF